MQYSCQSVQQMMSKNHNTYQAAVHSEYVLIASIEKSTIFCIWRACINEREGVSLTQHEDQRHRVKTLHAAFLNLLAKDNTDSKLIMLIGYDARPPIIGGRGLTCEG